jgi:HSP20 family protein
MITRMSNWSPFTELSRLQREFDRMFGGGLDYTGSDFPAVNIWTGDDEVVLTAELPGINPDDLDISVQNNTVTIRGERQAEKLDEGQEYIRRERESGTFTRSFRLPMRIDEGAVKAECRRGVLELSLPRAEEDKPKRITVNAG